MVIFLTRASVLVALLALGPFPLAAQGSASVDLALARFRRPADSVLVQTVVRVPIAVLDRLPGEGKAAYRCTILIMDAAGADVRWDTRTGVVSEAELARPGGVVLLRPEYVLPAGTYRVSVTLTDSASGRRLSAEGVINPLRTVEPVSDLLLEPRPGPLGPLAYYLELYSPDHSAAGRFWLRVEDSAGEVRWFGPPQHVSPFLGMAPHRGALDLEALGPGGYRLLATAELEGQRETRAVSFDIGAPARRPVAAPPRDIFALAAEAALDSMYGPLVYLMTPPEQGLYPILTLPERRAFLRTLWAQRDPTPGTPRNEAYEDHAGRLKDVNRRFREGGVVEVPGWRTDRGRVFLRHGPPDLVLRRPPGPRTAGYEVWKYTRDTVRKYIFLDLTRFGNYTLIWSNDTAEVTRSNWLALLGAEAAEDAVRF